MKRPLHAYLFCLGLAAALFGATPAAATEPCPGEGHGKLLIHGGGGNPELFVDKALELCGGRKTRILVVPYAAGNLQPQSEDEVPYFRAVESVLHSLAKAAYVDMIDLETNPDTALSEAIRKVEWADYIFFGGGGQARLMDWMNKYPALVEAIRKRHREGALIGGSSAGAAVLSKVMIKGNMTANPRDILAGTTPEMISVRSATPDYLGEGLGFWPEVILDQHFLVRKRWARLFSAVLDNPGLIGIGIDEGMAILADESSFEVFGDSSVVVFDARKATVSETEDGKPRSASGIAFQILKAGDRYQWKRDSPKQ